jgi:hypothetical protein
MPDRRISGSFTGSSFAYLVSALAHNAMEEIAPAKVADKLDRIANRVRLEGDIKPSSQYTIERRDDGVDFRHCDDCLSVAVYDAVGDEYLFSDMDQATEHVRTELWEDDNE